MPENAKTYPYKPAILKDRGGNLKKRWYVEFYAFDLRTDKLKRAWYWIPKKLTNAAERKAHAQKAIKEINSFLQSGYCYDSPPQPIEPEKEKPLFELLKEIVKEKEQTSREDTGRTYRSNHRIFVNWLQDKHPKVLLCSQFTPRLANDFKKHLLGLELSNRYINNLRNVISGFFGILTKEKYFTSNPFENVSNLKVIKSFNPPFTDAEIASLQDYFQKNDVRLYHFTRFMYYSLIRRTELCKLRISNINVQGRFITIPSTISKNTTTETIPIYEPLLKVIEEMSLDQYPQNFYVFGANGKPSNNPCKVSTVTHNHKKATDFLEIEGKTLYSWKDTGVVNAYRAGMDIRTLQNLLRHSSLEMVEIYLASLGLRIDKSKLNISW